MKFLFRFLLLFEDLFCLLSIYGCFLSPFTLACILDYISFPFLLTIHCTLNDEQQQQDDEEEELEGSGNIFAMWFLNPGDPVCRENIWYFEHRVDMKKIGAVKTERIASQHSVRASIASLFGMHLDPLYLLPAANLIINRSHHSASNKTMHSSSGGSQI